MRHAIPISGKDSLCTALLQMERRPDLTYEFFFNEVGFELPDTLEWLKRVEAYLGAPILRVGDNLEDIIDFAGILPSAQARFCTRQAKIEPTEDHFTGEDVTIYYGLRADEPDRVGYTSRKKSSKIIAAYPLREEGYTLSMVWARLESADLLPPAYFWQSLYELVIRKLGENTHQLSNLKPWEHRSIFAWRSRDNCYSCFYQRLYEWVGLLEHYPDLFWHAVEIEERTGAATFTMNNAKSLRKIASEAERIRNKRADAIVKMLATYSNLSFFGDESASSLMDSVSCGLLCGK